MVSVNFLYRSLKDKSFLLILIALKEFYNSKNIVPKCLCCGSIDVSLLSFENQNHICGGKIVEIDLGREGSTGEFTELVYDQFGNSKVNVFTISFLEPQKLLRKLEKPYFI